MTSYSSVGFDGNRKFRINALDRSLKMHNKSRALIVKSKISSTGLSHLPDKIETLQKQNNILYK